ncbi:MAG: tyrosine-type recombinase/integrase [Archaeoglobus sp.]|nr:tyrosine-type recombinase/integrase [Archaeoglobus sp.]
MPNSLDRLLLRIKKEFGEDGVYVDKFVKELLAEGISDSRIATYVQYLILIRRVLGKNMHEYVKDDVINVLAYFKNGVRKGRYAHNTYVEVCRTLKKFFKWMRREELISWFRKPKPESNVTPQDLITRDEFERMINVCKNSRDRALISVFFETGARIGEISNMRVRDVTFDEYGAVIWLPKSKTMRRRLRVVYSAPYLAQWLNDHPGGKGDDPLWVCFTRNMGKKLSEDQIRRHIKKISQRAGINKRIYPHLFRHTRATKLLKEVPESIVNKYMGWVPGSRMIQVYQHLLEEDVEEKILEMYGIKQRDNGKDLEVRQCPRCLQINDGNARFCSRCGLPLTEEAVREVEKWEKREAESVRDLNALLEIAKVKERLKELEEMLKNRV